MSHEKLADASRIVVEITLENAIAPSHKIHRDALGDTGAASTSRCIPLKQAQAAIDRGARRSGEIDRVDLTIGARSAEK